VVVTVVVGWLVGPHTVHTDRGASRVWPAIGWMAASHVVTHPKCALVCGQQSRRSQVTATTTRPFLSQRCLRCAHGGHCPWTLLSSSCCRGPTDRFGGALCGQRGCARGCVVRCGAATVCSVWVGECEHTYTGGVISARRGRPAQHARRHSTWQGIALHRWPD
jgi:hypothetical protein